MLTRQRNLNVCVLLLGTSLIALVNVGHAAKSSPKGAARKSPVKVKTPTDAMRTNGQKPKIVLRPRAEVYSSGNSNAKGSPAAAPKPAPFAGNASVTRNIHGSGINTSKVASSVNGRKLNELSALPHDKFSTVGQRIQNGQLDSQLQGANSAVLAGLNKVMPGFQTRAGKGASSLKDLGSTGGNHRNPVGGMMDQFTGGGVGLDGKGGKSNSTHHQDGSTTIRNKDGSTTDVWKDGTIVTQNKDGTTEVNRNNGQTDYYGKDGRKQASSGISRKIIDPDKPGFYTDGTPVASDKKDGGKQGSKKEPTPDDGTSDSSPKYITAATLRGLESRFDANRTSTGEEESGGGPIDNSRTREGRLGQVGQPVNDQGSSTGVAIDNMQLRQIARLRMRLIDPIRD